jgi:hypothetical protein
MNYIDELAKGIVGQMDLDDETTSAALEEIRGHLEEAVANAADHGLAPEEALARAAARFGADDVAHGLQEVHAGRGTADAVLAAGLPVACALLLRWTVFAPDGTAIGWQQVLTRPAFWVIATAALLVPLLRLRRWSYGLASWAFFWFITVTFVLTPALRW